MLEEHPLLMVRQGSQSLRFLARRRHLEKALEKARAAVLCLDCIPGLLRSRGYMLEPRKSQGLQLGRWLFSNPLSLHDD